MATYLERYPTEDETEGNRTRIFFDKIKQLNGSISRFLHLTITKSVIFLLIFSMTVPTLIYFFLIHKIILESGVSTCLIDRTYRVPCGKVNITKQECGDVHCCYDTDTNECFHYLPSEYGFLKEPSSGSYMTTRYRTPFLRNSFEKLHVQTFCREQKLYSITLSKNSMEIENTTGKANAFPNECDLKSVFDPEKLSVDVFRNVTGERLLTTSLGPLIASDYYLEWTMLLTSERMWGLGEIQFPANTTTTKIIYKNKDDHNTLPKFMAYVNGSYHGVHVETTAPLEISILPSYLIILRVLGGDSFKITIASGPTPMDVVRQLYGSDTIYSPPYWSLGPHICREGTTNATSIINEYREWKETVKDDIEYSSDCIHEDLYLHLFNVTDEELGEITGVLDEMHNDTKFLMSFPPLIPVSNTTIYNMSVNLKYLYENETGGLLYGKYHGKVVVYPGYFPIDDWSRTWLKVVPETPKLGGFVLNNNWPTLENYTFVDKGTFPYLNDGLKRAFSGTIPFNSSSIFGRHLLSHNLYGYYQKNIFTDYTSKIPEPIIMSSSFFYTHLVDAVNIQNVNTSWVDLKRALHTTLSNSLFGSRLSSVPVCGDTKHYDPKLHEKVCMRWYIMAATMPVFRISSVFPRRDPHNLPSGQAYQVARDAIEKRRSLQPYFYSALHTKYAVIAKPLVRPMFYDFYWDEETFDYNQQYMVGDALLMAQPFLPGQTEIFIYLPPSVGIWYEFWGGSRCKNLGKTQIDIVESDWITFIAGGKIVPMRNHDGNATNRDSLSLVIALNCTDIPPSCTSNGIMYSKHSYATFTGNSTGVVVGNLNNITRQHFGCYNDDTCPNCPNVIKTLKVYGLDGGSPNIFTKNVSICTEIVGDEMYFTYK